MQVKSYKSGTAGQVEFDETPFGAETPGKGVLYRTLKDAVVQYQANQRQGTASTKTRGQVAGSRKKPWKQKHTGRARSGDRKSPIWRGGGTVFGPKPRDYSYHMPVKARRVALRSAIYGKLRDDEVVIADLGEFPRPSSKDARRVLQAVGTPRRATVVLADRDDKVWRSFRNFPGVTVRTAADLCAFDVVAGGTLIAEAAAMDALVARVSRTGKSASKKSAGGDA